MGIIGAIIYLTNTENLTKAPVCGIIIENTGGHNGKAE